jgi:hypothetical protein
MKKLFVLFAAFISASAYSQQGLNLPAPSPAASVSQVFGLTKVDIVYSSPGVKNRQIWGSLVVPYDSIWRTGANSTTTINFSTDVEIGGQKLKQGKYALFTIPGKDTWTIIINSDLSGFGAFDYKKSMDVVRLTVKPMSSDFKERMAFLLDPVSDSVCRVTLWWEKLKVSFDVSADTKTLVQKGIEDFTENSKNLWRSYANAANYYADNHLDLGKAKAWAQQSVAMMEHFYNRYVMAKVLQAQGDKKGALTYALEAKKLGDTANDEFYKNYKDRVEKLVADLGGGKK